MEPPWPYIAQKCSPIASQTDCASNNRSTLIAYRPLVFEKSWKILSGTIFGTNRSGKITILPAQRLQRNPTQVCRGVAATQLKSGSPELQIVINTAERAALP
jgi:hypothetical protein